jgi:hypothetical protein
VLLRVMLAPGEGNHLMRELALFDKIHAHHVVLLIPSGKRRRRDRIGVRIVPFSRNLVLNLPAALEPLKRDRKLFAVEQRPEARGHHPPNFVQVTGHA